MSISRTVLIDDESHCNETLQYFLEQDYPQIDIIAVFTDPKEAALFLSENEIDLLFLDVQMPILNGFDLLNKLEHVDFEVIFVTAFDHFAIKAIKYSAFDYLQKPVEPDELALTLTKLFSFNRGEKSHSQLKHLLNLVSSKKTALGKISLPTTQGYIFIEVKNIIWCKSDGNYLDIKLTDGSKILVNRSLKEMQDILADQFIRTHNSFLVNKELILSLSKSNGPSIEMIDKTEIPISRHRKDEVFSILIP